MSLRTKGSKNWLSMGGEGENEGPGFKKLVLSTLLGGGRGRQGRENVWRPSRMGYLYSGSFAKLCSSSYILDGGTDRDIYGQKNIGGGMNVLPQTLCLFTQDYCGTSSCDGCGIYFIHNSSNGDIYRTSVYIYYFSTPPTKTKKLSKHIL